MYVGMNRPGRSSRRRSSRVPHVRGDEPFLENAVNALSAFPMYGDEPTVGLCGAYLDMRSPCSVGMNRVERVEGLAGMRSPCVGMNRNLAGLHSEFDGVPHVNEDEPAPKFTVTEEEFAFPM